MEILNSEIVLHGDFIPSLIFTGTFGVILSLAGSYVYREISKVIAILIVLLSVICWIGFFETIMDYDDYKIEERVVIVEDWNIIHNENWEVIKTEGKITTIREKLNNE